MASRPLLAPCPVCSRWQHFPKLVVVYVGRKPARQSLCYLWLHWKRREKQQRVKERRKNLNNKDCFRSGWECLKSVLPTWFQCWASSVKCKFLRGWGPSRASPGIGAQCAEGNAGSCFLVYTKAPSRKCVCLRKPGWFPTPNPLLEPGSFLQWCLALPLYSPTAQPLLATLPRCQVHAS